MLKKYYNKIVKPKRKTIKDIIELCIKFNINFTHTPSINQFTVYFEHSNSFLIISLDSEKCCVPDRNGIVILYDDIDVIYKKLSIYFNSMTKISKVK